MNIISQSDIVRYLLEHREELGEHGMTSVGELGFGQKEIISVPPEMSAIEALKVMNDKQIGAVGVVNSTGQIIGNFSAADMRYGHTFGLTLLTLFQDHHSGAFRISCFTCW